MRARLVQSSRAEQRQAKGAAPAVGAAAIPSAQAAAARRGGSAQRRRRPASAKASKPTADAAAPAPPADAAALLERWASAGRLLRRLPATTGDGSSSSDSDGEQEQQSGWARPAALALEPDGAAVLDARGVRLYKWLPKLRLWHDGRGALDMRRPRGVVALGGGELAVADADRGCVAVLGADGAELRTVGRLRRGALRRPTALAADIAKDQLAVFDSEPAPRVQLHRASTGALLRTFSLDGLGVRDVPAGGLALDGAGHVAVADPGGRRVLRLRIIDGGCATQLCAGPGSALSHPTAVAALPDGSLLVADRGEPGAERQCCLQLLRAGDGRWLSTLPIGRGGGGASARSEITALAVDARGQIFVALGAEDGDGGELLLLSGPAAAPAPSRSEEPAAPPELPPEVSEPLEKAALQRQRQAAAVLKEQFISAVVEQKLTLRSLFITSGGGDAHGETAEPQVNATQLSEVLRRLGIGASAVAEEMAMLLALLSDDDCSEALPAVDSVPLRRLEHLKAAECRRLAQVAQVAQAAQPAGAETATPRVEGSPAATETPGSGRKGKRVMNAESLRAMLALSPAQENERRAWQAYDSALEAARSKQRPAPTPPQLLLGFDGNHARPAAASADPS